MSDTNPYVTAGRERKASALIALLLGKDFSPDLVDSVPDESALWAHWATVAGIKPPSVETVHLTKDRYRRVHQLRHLDPYEGLPG